MNNNFRVLWNNLSNDVQMKYDNCNTSFIKDKNVLEYEGVKYAVLILNNMFKGVSKKTCEFYLKLNDDFHPNTKPEHIKIHNCIIELKKCAQNIALDNEILDEIDSLCLQDK